MKINTLAGIIVTFFISASFAQPIGIPTDPEGTNDAPKRGEKESRTVHKNKKDKLVIITIPTDQDKTRKTKSKDIPACSDAHTAVGSACINSKGEVAIFGGKLKEGSAINLPSCSDPSYKQGFCINQGKDTTEIRKFDPNHPEGKKLSRKESKTLFMKVDTEDHAQVIKIPSDPEGKKPDCDADTKFKSSLDPLIQKSEKK